MEYNRYLKMAKEKIRLIRILLLILAAMHFSIAAVAGDPAEENRATVGEDQIEIEADELVTNNAEKFAEFSGDVRASQGALVITSERLKIYYQTAPDSAARATADQESIKQIIATGNVQISTEKFTAETDRAEYDPQTKVVVLIGENSSLKSNRNILTGSKIIVDRKTGQMRAESHPQKRVKAVFYPKENSQQKE